MTSGGSGNRRKNTEQKDCGSDNRTKHMNKREMLQCRKTTENR